MVGVPACAAVRRPQRAPGSTRAGRSHPHPSSCLRQCAVRVCSKNGDSENLPQSGQEPCGLSPTTALSRLQQADAILSVWRGLACTRHAKQSVHTCGLPAASEDSVACNPIHLSRLRTNPGMHRGEVDVRGGVVGQEILAFRCWPGRVTCGSGEVASVVTKRTNGSRRDPSNPCSLCYRPGEARVEEQKAH